MKIKLISGITAAAAGTWLLFAADSSPATDSAKIEQLNQRIATLEARLNRLEAQIAAPVKLQMSPPSPVILERDAPLQEPPNIGSRDVNGMKVFIVPLQHP